MKLISIQSASYCHFLQRCFDNRSNTWVYPKVSGLAAWSEDYKRYSSLPLGAAVSLFWVSLVSFVAIALCVAPQRVFVFVVYFVIDSVRKLLDTPSYDVERNGKVVVNGWMGKHFEESGRDLFQYVVTLFAWIGWENINNVRKATSPAQIRTVHLPSTSLQRYVYDGISKSFRTESITKYTLTVINTRWEATQRVMRQNSLDWLTK
jgi:hypothetical protein